MDQKTLDFILAAIESLRNDQKTIARKVITLSDAVKNSFAKMKREKIEENTALEDKLGGLNKRCEKLNCNIENHQESVERLERDKNNLEKMIEKIDNNLEDANKKIGESLLKIENLTVETQKQCIFDRKGFCREEESCRFFHSNEICSEHVEQGVCNKTNCRKRHPRNCRNFKRSICLRGESCKYLHNPGRDENKCNKCEKFTLQKYFCEFCKKSFCPECTVEEAHHTNLYNNDGQPTCSKIHI